MGILVKFIIALFLCGASRSLYTKDDDVVILTEGNFEEEVLNCDALWIVEFYAPWCGHCKNLEPEFIGAAKALKGVAYLGAVDSTVEKDIANKYGINRYPTIKVFGVDKEKESGTYEVKFSASSCHSGESLACRQTGGNTETETFYYRLEAGDYRSVKKMELVK